MQIRGRIGSSSHQHEFHNNHRNHSDRNSDFFLAQGFPTEQETLVPDTIPVVGQKDDWREFRAKLVKSSQTNTLLMGEEDHSESSTYAEGEEEQWAHILSNPEKGCLLLANPLMFTTAQTYFNKAVILLFSHGIDGSAGVILNKPTQHIMKEFKDASTLPNAYDDCTLYLGGDVGPEILHILHGVDGINDADHIVPGVYLGGVQGVADAMESGRASALDVKLLTRYAGWGPGQLEEEIKAGVWIVSAASRDVILGRYSVRQRLSGVEKIGDGDDMWHSVLQLMGGEYAALSEAVSEDYRPDIMELPDNKGDDDESSSDARGYHQRDQRDSGDDDFLGHGI